MIYLVIYFGLRFLLWWCDSLSSWCDAEEPLGGNPIHIHVQLKHEVQLKWSRLHQIILSSVIANMVKSFYEAAF